MVDSRVGKDVPSERHGVVTKRREFLKRAGKSALMVAPAVSILIAADTEPAWASGYGQNGGGTPTLQSSRSRRRRRRWFWRRRRRR